MSWSARLIEHAGSREIASLGQKLNLSKINDRNNGLSKFDLSGFVLGIINIACKVQDQYS